MNTMLIEENPTQKRCETKRNPYMGRSTSRNDYCDLDVGKIQNYQYRKKYNKESLRGIGAGLSSTESRPCTTTAMTIDSKFKSNQLSIDNNQAEQLMDHVGTMSAPTAKQGIN